VSAFGESASEQNSERHTHNRFTKQVAMRRERAGFEQQCTLRTG
jgi:hypothetical protein